MNFLQMILVFSLCCGSIVSYPLEHDIIFCCPTLATSTPSSLKSTISSKIDQLQKVPRIDKIDPRQSVASGDQKNYLSPSDFFSILFIPPIMIFLLMRLAQLCASHGRYPLDVISTRPLGASSNETSKELVSAMIGSANQTSTTKELDVSKKIEDHDQCVKVEEEKNKIVTVVEQGNQVQKATFAYRLPYDVAVSQKSDYNSKISIKTINLEAIGSDKDISINEGNSLKAAQAAMFRSKSSPADYKRQIRLKSEYVEATGSDVEVSMRKGSITPSRKAAQAAISRLKSSPASVSPLDWTHNRDMRNLQKSGVASVSALLPAPSSAKARPNTTVTSTFVQQPDVHFSRLKQLAAVTLYAPPIKTNTENERHFPDAIIDNRRLTPAPFHAASLNRRCSDSDPSLNNSGIVGSTNDQVLQSNMIQPPLPEDTSHYGGGMLKANLSQTASPSSEALKSKEIGDQGEVVAGKASELPKKRTRDRSRSHRSSKNCRRTILIAAIFAVGFLVVGLCIGLAIYFSSAEQKKSNKN